MEDQIKQLELRVTELENKLKAASASASPQINAEDYQTYQKVSGQLAQVICQICIPHYCRPCWPPLCICPCGPGFCQVCRPCIQQSSSMGSADFSSFM